MANKAYPKVKRGSMLWAIGFWATVWWTVSCLYVLLAVWQIMNRYSDVEHTGGFKEAVSYVYENNDLLWVLLLTILMGWAIGAYFWMQELKNQKVPYKVAFKDLFLTIRK